MTTVLSPPRRYTPDDLLEMPGGDAYELVNGMLVERNMGWNASYIGGQLFGALLNYCAANPIGVPAPADASYRCFPDDPGKVRRPDASFIRVERLPPPEEREGHCSVAPDLAVEVISPRDLYSDVEEKVAEYLAAGVQIVWVVNPPTRTVRVHRADGTVSDLGEGDILLGESLLPGFECSLAELFTVPGARQPTA